MKTGRGPTSFRRRGARRAALVLLVGVGALAVLVRCDSGGAKLLTPPRILGTWGGDGIHLTIDFQGAEVRYNCAFGTMDEPIIPDETGRLEVDGTYVVEVGPCCGNPRPARHDGTISGAGMVLTRTLLDTGESETFSLVFGDDGRVEFCY